MFSSVKLKSVKATAFSLLCLLIFLAVCLVALRASAPDTVTVNGKNIALGYKNSEDIRAFISVCGYETENLVHEQQITVPEVWNAAYTDYNDLQRLQGLDLVPYKGKSAMELTYSLADGGYATLLVTDSRIIAAHLSNFDSNSAKPLIEQ